MGSERRRLGDFELVREIGRGGMGVVYEATQLSLNRRVALKVLPWGITTTDKDVTRFRREAEAAGKLHHPNIVSVYAVGEADDQQLDTISQECRIHLECMANIDIPALVLGDRCPTSNLSPCWAGGY